MKKNILYLSVFFYCVISNFTSEIAAQNDSGKTKKTVVIKYNPDNRDVTKIVPIETVSYTTIEKLCKPMLTEKGTMAYLKERKAVIIFDKKKNTEKIASFIKEIDIPAVNVRIDVDFIGSGDSKDDRLNVTFGSQDFPNRDNQLIFRNGKLVKIDRIAASGVRRSGQTSRNTSQFIVTQSGRPARLWVGRRIVDPTWLRNRVLVPTVIVLAGGGGAAVVIPGSDNEIIWRDIGSALYVLPTYLGSNRIKLDIYPIVSYLVDDPADVVNNRNPRRQTVMVQDVKTSLTLQNGQRVSMGGVINSNKNFYTNLFGPDFLSSTGGNSVLDMYVTATVIKPGSSGRKSYIPRTPDVIPKK